MAKLLDGHLSWAIRYWLNLGIIGFILGIILFTVFTLFFSLIFFPWLFGQPLGQILIFTW